jgi:hypothetical protein
MKTTRKLSADSQRLIAFAQAIATASSRLEARAWERDLDVLLEKLLKHENQDTIETALDHLFAMQPIAYDALMGSIESASESCIVEYNGMQYNALLVAAPILAWTRFSIASGPIPQEVLTKLTDYFKADLLASGTLLAIAPILYAIDQLPRTYSAAYTLTQRMAHAALSNSMPRQTANAPETAPFLADTRYVLAVVAAPVGEPLFCWQRTRDLNDRANAISQWRSQATPEVARMLPGCGIELIAPAAYYIACREADKQIRPVSIRAAMNFLTHTLNAEPDQFQVVIGKFGDMESGQINEFRISFILANKPDVLYGIVWPLYGTEDAEQELTVASGNIFPQAGEVDQVEDRAPIEQITEVLKESGLANIKQLSEHFPMEFCDDCGAPLFPDAHSELVHAEMPEDAEQGTEHFH